MAITQKLIRSCLAEFLGVVIFVFIGGLSLGAGGGAASSVSAPFAHGLTIAILVATLGPISGAHVNPAVTLGVLISGNMKIIEAIGYWIAQFSGGLLGAFGIWCVSTAEYYKDACGGAITPGTCNADEILDLPKIFPIQGIIAEAIMTCLLVKTVLVTAVDKKGSALAPLAIGFCIVVDAFGGGGLTGASMNPARSFGPSVIASIALKKYKFSKNIWKYQYIYYIGPFIGGAVAAVVYKAILATDRWFLKDGGDDAAEPQTVENPNTD